MKEKKSLTIEWVTWSGIKLESKKVTPVTRKWKKKSLIFELVTRSNFFIFCLRVSNSKCNFLFFDFELVIFRCNFLRFNFDLVTRKWKNKIFLINSKWTFNLQFWVSNSKLDFELVTRSVIVLFFNFEFVTRSETIYFSTSS